MTDPIEEGYKRLANDPEFDRPYRGKHHCGFDFKPDQATAKCVCGAVATNPFWTIKGEK